MFTAAIVPVSTVENDVYAAYGTNSAPATGFTCVARCAIPYLLYPRGGAKFERRAVMPVEVRKKPVRSVLRNYTRA